MCFEFGGLNTWECKLAVPPFALRRYAKLMQSMFHVVLCSASGRFFSERAALLLDAPRYQHSAVLLVFRLSVPYSSADIGKNTLNVNSVFSLLFVFAEVFNCTSDS